MAIAPHERRDRRRLKLVGVVDRTGHDLVAAERPPALALVVTVEEVFMHCAKAFLRARLWDPDCWDPEGIVPRPAVIAQLTHRPDETLEALDAHYARNYAGGLY